MHGPERDRQELAILTSLGPALMATKGYASAEVEECFGRTAALHRRMGNMAQLFEAQQGLWVGYLVQAKLDDALALAEDLHRQSHQMGDPFQLLVSHTMLGMSQFHRGDPGEARDHLGQAATLRQNSAQVLSPDLLYSFLGVYFKVNVLSYQQHALWLLGDARQALQLGAEAVAQANQSMHPYSQVAALAFAAVTSLLCRETALAEAQIPKALELSAEHGFLQWHAHATILRGRVLAEAGKPSEGIALMQEGLAEWQVTGAKLANSYYLGLLAEGHAIAGQVEQGLSTLATALVQAETYGELWYVAELYRLRGELRLRQGDVTAAEADFLEAIAVAAKQQARSLQLRAVISLARLWQQQRMTEMARDELANTVESFADKVVGRDMDDANALLAQLPEA